MDDDLKAVYSNSVYSLFSTYMDGPGLRTTQDGIFYAFGAVADEIWRLGHDEGSRAAASHAEHSRLLAARLARRDQADDPNDYDDRDEWVHVPPTGA